MNNKANSVDMKKRFCEKCGKEMTPLQLICDKCHNIRFDEFTDIYIQKNVNHFYSGSFSIWTFLFGSIYAAYRKQKKYSIYMNIIAILAYAFAIDCAVSDQVLKPLGVSVLVFLLFGSNFILAITFKKQYKLEMTANIKKLVKKYDGAHILQIENECKKMGGVSLFWAFVTFSIYFILHLY